MICGSVPSSWLGLTGVMSAKPLLALLEEVTARGIAQTDLPAVKRVWDEMNQKVTDS